MLALPDLVGVCVHLSGDPGPLAGPGTSKRFLLTDDGMGGERDAGRLGVDHPLDDHRHLDRGG